MKYFTDHGFTLIEMLISLLIGAMLFGAMAAMMRSATSTVNHATVESGLYQSAAFAMDRMSRSIERARYGFLPLGENPATVYLESQRSLLAVSMDPTLDRDQDGWADANNDRDWLDYNNNGVRDANEPEKIDEDPGHDITNDAAPGIVGVDDDNDGAFDEDMEFDDPLKSAEDDDEDGWKNDDNTNGFDDDNDGTIDEDWKQEINDDHAPGLVGFDDNYDGLIDDHPAYPNGGDSKEARRDDDEDGVENEDGPEVVLYYLGATEVYNASGDSTPVGSANTLYERITNNNATFGDQFSVYAIAENVQSFTVTRLPSTELGGGTRFELSLVVQHANGEDLTLSRILRLGAQR